MSVFTDTKSVLEDIAINEVYFGKTNDILKAEYQLDKFRKPYMGSYMYNEHVNSNPDLLKFNRIMEDIFGFGCFSLHVHNQTVVNAFTAPIDYKIDSVLTLRHNTIADEKGYRFKKEADYTAIVGIYSGIIFNPNFTTPEVFAIILHEVGHNFNSAINAPNAILSSAFSVTLATAYIATGNFFGLFMNTNKYNSIVEKTIIKLREDKSFVVDILDNIMAGFDILNNIKHMKNHLLRAYSLGLYTLYKAFNNNLAIIGNPITLGVKVAFIPAKYRSEESADNFATMYGYGPDLSSALKKMTTSAEKDDASAILSSFNQIPVLSQIMHMIEVPAYMLAGLLDEHPHSINRLKDQVRMLEKELEKEDLDPKMKKYIMSDIEAINMVISDACDVKNNVKDPYLGNIMYNNVVNALPDIKRLLFGNPMKFDAYEKSFKRGILNGRN